MRNRGESAAEAGRENLYIINGLQKTSPLKGVPWETGVPEEAASARRGFCDAWSWGEQVRRA